MLRLEFHGKNGKSIIKVIKQFVTVGGWIGGKIGEGLILIRPFGTIVLMLSAYPTFETFGEVSNGVDLTI